METTSLVTKVQEELDTLEAIYTDDGVCEQEAQEQEDGSVTCVLKLLPKTGCDSAKVAVIIRIKFTF
jgi:hypothetical protein